MCGVTALTLFVLNCKFCFTLIIMTTVYCNAGRVDISIVVQLYLSFTDSIYEVFLLASGLTSQLTMMMMMMIIMTSR